MLTAKRRHALPRHEIARGKASLSRLFETGSRRKGGALMTITSFVARQDAGNGAPVRILFGVGKRQVPLAADRNRIKRLMREAYRLEKPILSKLMETEVRNVAFIAFMYRSRGDAIPALQDFRAEVGRLLKVFVREWMAMNDEHEHGG